MEPLSFITAFTKAPATGLYPDPHQSSPCLSIPILEDPFYYYPPIYARVFQVVSFSRGLPAEARYAPLLCPIRATCSAHLLDLITRILSGVKYRHGDRGGTVVKVLRYKSEGRWFDSRWCHWNFSLT